MTRFLLTALTNAIQQYHRRTLTTYCLVPDRLQTNGRTTRHTISATISKFGYNRTNSTTV